jgi:hypothetical protein
MLRARSIVNGRLIMVETQTSCYYRYIVFETEERNFALGQNNIKSPFEFTSWLAAMSAGKKYVQSLTPTPTSNKNEKV